MSVETASSILLDQEDIAELVARMYRTFLHREPDPQGKAHWIDQLTAGVPLDQVIHVFATSEEFLERNRKSVLAEVVSANGSDLDVADLTSLVGDFPADYTPPGEAGRSYQKRLRSGFLNRYCSGSLVLDVGFSGYDNPDRKTALPGAIGVDLDYPGYDGIRLPFDDGTVDCVFSSHCLEHIQFDHAAVRDWYRVLRIGAFIVCMVPSQALYEKRRFLPSSFNADHKRMYTPSSLARIFEESLDVNSYRIRHLAENDDGFDYSLGPEVHSAGAYEIEIVVEKILPPKWGLA